MRASLACLLLSLGLAFGLTACSDGDDDAANKAGGTQLIGITDELRILGFAPDSPGTASGAVTITGYTIDSPASPPFPLAFDFRPSTGELYLLLSDDRLYTVNPASGVATLKGRISAGSGIVAMAFDPAADVIRVLTGNGGNLRISPANASTVATDTTLAYASGDANAGIAQGVEAIAYAQDGSGAATAFVLDTTNDILARLGSVNGTPDSAGSGRLNTIGGLSIAIGGGNTGFDITRGASPVAYTLDTDATSTRVYRVNLANGMLTLLGTINGSRLIGLAVAPASASSTPGLGAGLISGEGSCTAALGGSGVTVTKDLGGVSCLLCSITGEANLADGNVNSPAVVNFMTGLLLEPVSVTVKAPLGVVFPAGRVAGGTFAIPGTVPLSLGLIPDITVSTALAGVDTGENFPAAGGLLNLSLLGVGLTPGDDRFFVGFTTTKPFDTVKLTLTPGVASVLLRTEIYAACANGTPGDELPAGLLPLP